MKSYLFHDPVYETARRTTDPTNRKPAVRMAAPDTCPLLSSAFLQSPTFSVSVSVSVVAHRLQMFPSDKEAGLIKVVFFFPVAHSLIVTQPRDVRPLLGALETEKPLGFLMVLQKFVKTCGLFCV